MTSSFIDERGCHADIKSPRKPAGGCGGRFIYLLAVFNFPSPHGSFCEPNEANTPASANHPSGVGAMETIPRIRRANRPEIADSDTSGAHEPAALPRRRRGLRLVILPPSAPQWILAADCASPGFSPRPKHRGILSFLWSAQPESPHLPMPWEIGIRSRCRSMPRHHRYDILVRRRMHGYATFFQSLVDEAAPCQTARDSRQGKSARQIAKASNERLSGDRAAVLDLEIRR